MESLGIGEVAYWDLDTTERFAVRFKPGSYIAWAKGVFFQNRPSAPVDRTVGHASLLFGNPLQTIDECSLDLGPIPDPHVSELISSAFALEAAFIVEFQIDIQVHPPDTLRLQADGFGTSHVSQLKLMVMGVEKVTIHPLQG